MHFITLHYTQDRVASNLACKIKKKRKNLVKKSCKIIILTKQTRVKTTFIYFSILIDNNSIIEQNRST